MEVRYGKCCVYTHSVDGVIVYVGKGTAYRAFDTKNSRGPVWHRYMEKAGSYDVQIVAWFGDAESAFALERQMIKDVRPLLNLTHTGNATAGRGKALTAEHRAKISAGNTGRVNSPAARAKLSAALKGRKLSESARAACAEGQRKRRAREGFPGYGEEHKCCNS